MPDFDAVRGAFGDGGSTTIAGMDFSTYQVIILVGFFLTIPDLIAILFIRRGVEMTENGVKITPPEEEDTSIPLSIRIRDLVKSSSIETWNIFKSVFPQRSFHIYLGMIGLLVFVRLTFYHFHYTFPTYGIRVFGEGVKIVHVWGFEPTHDRVLGATHCRHDHEGALVLDAAHRNLHLLGLCVLGHHRSQPLCVFGRNLVR